MTSGWQGAPYFRRHGSELVSKSAILSTKSRGGGLPQNDSELEGNDRPFGVAAPHPKVAASSLWAMTATQINDLVCHVLPQCASKTLVAAQIDECALCRVLPTNSALKKKIMASWVPKAMPVSCNTKVKRNTRYVGRGILVGDKPHKHLLLSLISQPTWCCSSVCMSPRPSSTRAQQSEVHSCTQHPPPQRQPEPEMGATASLPPPPPP